MIIMQESQEKSTDQAMNFMKQAALALILGGFLFTLFIVVALVFIQVWFAGRIFPNIQLNHIDLGGLSIDSALQKIQLADTYTKSVFFKLQFQDNGWEVSPTQLGVSFDPGTTLQNAYRVGRSGSIVKWLVDTLTLWNTQLSISPVFSFNQQIAYQYLLQLAEQINQPTMEAALQVRGTEVVAIPGQIGLTLDIPNTLALISEKIISQQGGVIPLIVTASQPEMLDASEYAEAARLLLSTPLVLTLPDEQVHQFGPWTISPDVLANMLVFDKIRNDSGLIYDVKLNENSLHSFLANIAKQANTQAENPRFIFNDDTRQLELIQSGLAGQTLDIQASITKIQTELKSNHHTIPLVFSYSQPAVANEATAQQLGIRELLHAETSYFYGSTSARIHNIQVAASRFHGLLVPPNFTFSMADAMGDVSLDSGYTEALIIFNGQTIEGVGGGVCQVSTTLFRTAFFSGFPINERHSHAYRVKYYEKTVGNAQNSKLAGLDATVYVPLVDLKFTNDTPYWLLMETYVSPQNNSITWKFYSTSDGRSVKWETSGPTNLVDPPKPLYKENATLKQGEIKQVDWEAQGADVTVNRSVFRNGALYFQDTFNTHYEPWRAVYEYGPGTDGIPQQISP